MYNLGLAGRWARKGRVWDFGFFFQQILQLLGLILFCGVEVKGRFTLLFA